MEEKLVLWKPRRQRKAETFIKPLVVLPVGPVLRGLLGDDYQPLFGFGTELLLLYLVALGGRLWAESHGGEWLSAPEQMQRLMNEVATVPRWQSALIRMGMLVPIIVAPVFIIQPVIEFGTGFGGPAVMASLILVLGLVGIIPTLTGQYRRLASSVPVERNAVPAGQILTESFRLLPRSYLSVLIATGAGFFAGRQFEGKPRVAVAIVVTLAVLQLTRQLPFFNKLPKRVYTSLTGFWSFIVVGIASWGVPYAIMFAGVMLLTMGGQEIPIVAGIGFMITIATLFGGFMGVWMFIINRTGRRRAVRNQT